MKPVVCTTSHHHRGQRQGEVPVGDRPTERALLLGSFGVDVDPLEVSGCFGELVDALLGDLHPVAVAEMLTDGLFQPGGSMDSSC